MQMNEIFICAYNKVKNRLTKRKISIIIDLTAKALKGKKFRPGFFRELSEGARQRAKRDITRPGAFG